MVLDALIVKHKMNLSDEETIWTIQENPYMQYMLGLSEFTDKPIFDSSLFVTIRKRLQIDDLNAFTGSLLAVQREKAPEKPQGSDNDNDAGLTDSQQRVHKGSMKIDATCSDAEVRYPTDIDLLNDGSRVINRYIDKLCSKFSLAHPVTFSKQSRKAYLEIIKHKKKTKKMIHVGKSQMLAYLVRDIRSFIGLIAVHGTGLLVDSNATRRKSCVLSLPCITNRNKCLKKEVILVQTVLLVFSNLTSAQLYGENQKLRQSLAQKWEPV